MAPPKKSSPSSKGRNTKAPISPPRHNRKKKQFKSPKKDALKAGETEPIVKKDIIVTESIGYGTEFLVATIESAKGVPGFLLPVKNVVMNGDDGTPGVKQIITGGDYLDCRNKYNLYMRQSRERNEKIPINGKHFYKLGIVSNPNKESLWRNGCTPAELDAEGENNLAYEKYFRNAIEDVLLEAEKEKIKATGVCPKIITRYERWNPSIHSRTPTTGITRFLDHLFIDESVGEIVKSYYQPGDIDDSQVYQFLKDGGFNCFFSRYNGFYSQYAQREYGFPGDCVENLNGYTSDDVDDSDESV